MVAAFQAAVDEDPNNVYARFNLATLLAADGLHERALAELERLTALVPGYEGGAAWYARGQSLLALGRWAEAMSSFERVLRLPYTGRCSHARATAGNAAALDRLGRREEARAARARAAALATREGREALEEGNIYASTRRWTDAVAAYDRSAGHDWSGAPVARLNRGLCKQAQGKLYEALADLQAAQARLPDLSAEDLARAVVHSSEEGAGGLGRLVDGLVATMADALGHYNRASVRARLENLPGAAEDLRAALALAPELAREARGDADFTRLRHDPAHADLFGPPHQDRPNPYSYSGA
jgi:tetratricopeptide (TPR) repeat protein